MFSSFPCDEPECILIAFLLLKYTLEGNRVRFPASMTDASVLVWQLRILKGWFVLTTLHFLNSFERRCEPTVWAETPNRHDHYINEWCGPTLAPVWLLRGSSRCADGCGFVNHDSILWNEGSGASSFLCRTEKFGLETKGGLQRLSGWVWRSAHGNSKRQINTHACTL